MKRITVMLLIVMLSFSLCACGSDQGDSIAYKQGISETVPQTGDRIEFHQPVFLVEDNYVSVEISNFFEAVSTYGNAPEKEKYITLKVNNKSDYPIMTYLKQLYIGNDSVIIQNGPSTVELAPGKSAVSYFKISTPANKPINSMEDLFLLEGTLAVIKDGADGSRTEVNSMPFSVKDAFSADAVNLNESKPPVELTLGETASTDMAEFTMTGFEIRSELTVDAYNIQIKEGKGTVHAPEKGMVYAAPVFTLRNLARESYKLDKTLGFVVDYNDGYQYKMEDYTCYITHEGGTWEYNDTGTSRGQRAELSPLMSGEYQVFVPAVDLIDTDRDSSLKMIVTLPANGGAQEFIYRIR